MGQLLEPEEEQLRSVAIQNAQSILAARQRAERELVAARDALEQRTTELERAHGLIRAITENAASGLMMLDESGRATYVNPAALDETGFTAEELMSAPVSAILHAPSTESGHEPDQCPLLKGRATLREYRDFFLRSNGSTFPAACSITPLERDGQPAGAVLEFRDITRQLLAQKTLEEANKQKDEFLATLSHELRTPMTSVLGWVRMLKLGMSDEEARDAIDAIEKAAEIQAQLIDDVLDVSRISAGKMTFRPQPCDLGTVVQAAITTVHPAAAAKDLEVLASIPPSLPRILGDEGRLQQIIWNLLANAVKFTPRGGTITIKVRQEGPTLALSVRDTGKGIDPAYLPHVFEPFSQEDGTTTRSHEGIGLGLSIARALVELHGGRIRAASAGQGRGATFTVELPVIEAPATITLEPQIVASPVVAMPLPAMNGLRLLVIDDHDLTRDVVCAIFRNAQATVTSASSVRQALEKFGTLHPDVVICDLAMPVEDGYAFVRAIRGLTAPHNATPIIALTAFGRIGDRQHAIAAGFDEYMKKPVDPVELTSEVLRLSARPS